MRASDISSIEEVSVAPGTIVVTIAVAASATEVWQALTIPHVAAYWFGDLAPELRPGISARLDFGDGDFFTLEDVQLDPPHRLQYTWRFLGIGPRDTITWHIAPQTVGCLVTVTDTELERSREAASCLREGWLDFVQRLERYLATGEPNRYDWRREFDGSIELPCRIEEVWDLLFAPDMQLRWLPLGGSVLQSGTRCTLPDGREPTTIQISDVAWEPPTRVQFYLTHTDWLDRTRCLVALFRRHHGTLLMVSHVGWEAIHRSSTDQLQQRQRFCALWITALQRVRQLVEASTQVIAASTGASRHTQT